MLLNGSLTEQHFYLNIYQNKIWLLISFSGFGRPLFQKIDHLANIKTLENLRATPDTSKFKTESA